MPEKKRSEMEEPDLSEPDLSEPVNIPDLSNPEAGFAASGPVNTQYPGYKAFDVSPFQGQRAIETFKLPTENKLFGVPMPQEAEALVGAAKGLGHSAVGIAKINANPETEAAMTRLQNEYLAPNPVSWGQEAGFQGEQLGEWVAPYGLEKKAEAEGAQLLGKLGKVRSILGLQPGEKGTIEALRGIDVPYWLRTVATLPRSAATALTGGAVAQAQGQDPREAAITGGVLSQVFGQAGLAGKYVSDSLNRAAKAKFMQAMGASTPEQVARAEKVVDDMMKNAPFFMTRRGMYNWAADRANSAVRDRALLEAPIATTWGVPVEDLGKQSTKQVQARSTFPNVPGYNEPANISEPWTKQATSVLDEYLGTPSQAVKPIAETLIKGGESLEQVRKTAGEKVGSGVYQAVRRGVPTNDQKWILPYIDMDAFKTWASKRIDYKHGWTTKKTEVWADEDLAPIKGIATAIAEAIRKGQPEIGKLNNIIESSMNVMDVLYPALEKPLPQEEGMKVLMGGSANVASRMLHIGMWHALLTGMRGVTNSTGWRTLQASQYSRIANLIERGRVEEAGRAIFTAMGYGGSFKKEPYSKVTAPEQDFDYEVR
jgi:hypothetical protein